METTNDLRYTVVKKTSKEDVQIKIRLNDECKNGHADFSMTGTRWIAGKPHTDGNTISSGAISDFIAKKFPEFKIFDKLHLCDRQGSPMHAAANGFYHLITQKMGCEEFCRYYRVSIKQYDNLKQAEDQDHFRYLLHTLGVVEQWQKEADEGCALLEKLTGLKFRDDSTQYQLAPFVPGEREAMEQRIKSGYYSDSNKRARAAAKRKEQRDLLEKEIKAEYDKETAKVHKEYIAKMIVLDSQLPLNNFIFYGHTLTGSFNWKGYERKVTADEFADFLDYAKDKTPEGVTWELKD